ncbi:unnamed protein product [Brassicogethes aeneus]|nr:unnamed protein product [Brassicogethes aeneus]
MNESDFSQKYDQYSSRPRPGTSSSNKIGLLIDPPPSSQKKSVPTSNDSESPDLISFSTTPHNTKKIINISNQQTFISKKILHNVHSNIITNQSQLDNSLVQDLYRTNLNSFSEILPNKKQIFSTLPRNQVPPLPLSLKSKTECEKKVSNNLIDLSSDKNNVRVSILEEFDPLLSSSSYRTMSQDICVVEDAASVSDSVYEEYDPYDYIHAGYNGTSVLESINTLIVKPDNLPHSPIPVSIKPDMEIIKGDWSLLEKLIKHDDILRQIKDPDLIEFYAMVYKLRNEYDYSDINRNIGLVISPMITIKCPEGLSVKLCVHPDYEEADFEKPVYFTCDVTTSIEHITLQLICELEAPSKDKYTLKVKGYDEYLVPTSLLSDYEYVHNCIKLEEDIVLILIPDNKIEKFFLRTKQDDTRDKDVQFNDILSYDLEQHINYESLTILIDTLENEMKKLDIPEIKAIQPQKVIQSVKCIVNLLGNLCTLDVIDSIEELQNICDSKSLESVKTGCNKIRIAIQCLLEMYSKAFLVNFKVTNLEIKSDITYVQDVLDPILIKVCLICRPLIKWKYHSYYVDARICHGSKELAKIAYDDPKYKKEHDMWPDRIVIDLWFQFDNIKINSLARESRLVLVIHGRILDETDNENNIPKFLEEEIGWASVQFFDFDG